MLVTLLVLNQGKIVVHELEPAHGEQTACEGLVDKTNYHQEFITVRVCNSRMVSAVNMLSCETQHQRGSLVPRPSPAPVFDRLQYVFAYCKRSKTGAGEGLGTRLPKRWAFT